MKIVSLTPGTGSFHCGSCLRDHSLVKALRALGHDALMVPMYLPLVTDEPVGSEDEQPIQYGGINVYLQQKSALFRKMPRVVDHLFNQQWMLKAAGKRAASTQASGLGELTISMFRGQHGQQNKELDKLIQWLDQTGRPDVVSLSNGLLSGLAGPIKKHLGSKVIISLQGEDVFLDSLAEEHRETAWQLFGENAAEADAIIAPSDYYRDHIRLRLGHDESLYHTIHNGIAVDEFVLSQHQADSRTIGFLARMCHGKGLHTLVESFILLKQDSQYADVRLRIAGAATDADRDYINQQKEALAKANLTDCVDWLENVSRQGKLAFLAGLSVMSVPANYGEAFGLYIVEAMASGVPLVQPRHGSFTELLEHTGGGILVSPENPQSLAEGLKVLLGDRDRRKEMGSAGRRAVEDGFTADRMARQFLGLCS